MPLPPTDRLPEKIGVESDIVEPLPSGGIRAKFRVAGGRPAFPEGDWLRVRVCARVYDPAESAQEPPRAEGNEVEATARCEWSVIDLPLPTMLRGEYAVCAKVYSADDRYRKLFEPSRCRLSLVTFGDLIRVDVTVLDDIYKRGGYGNPAAEEEIRRNVRAGAVVAVDESGRLFSASETDNGRLDLRPLSS